MNRRRLRAAIVVSLAVGFLCACGVSNPSPSPSEGATNLAIFDEGGIVLSYPSTWVSFKYDMTTSFSTLLGFLATVPVHDPCRRTTNSRTCIAKPYDLAPGTLVVRIETWGFLPLVDLDEMPLTVGGVPAKLEATGLATDHAQLKWQIMVPGSPSNYFAISADIRGPGAAAMVRAVRKMIDGLRFDPAPVTLPALAADRQAAAQVALIKVLTALRTDQPGYECFPLPPGGTRRALVAQLPSEASLPEPVLATCSTQIASTRLQMWRVRLMVRFDEPLPDGRSASGTELWLLPDGTLTVTTGYSTSAP